MKNILIPIIAIFIAGFSQAQLTNTENYVYSKTYLDYNGTTATKTAETVQYFDGLGRPKQVVNVKASPLGKDVVTHLEYDGFGRQVKDFLPVPQSGTMNGAIVPNPLANATQLILYGSEKIYTEKILENSPLDRIFEQKQVGNAWNNKPVKFEYDANSVADAVKKYTTITTWVNGATNSVPDQIANYGANQLYKNTVIDEDLNKTIEFKNGEGQTLLVRKMLDATNSVDTYYVYNEYNQLAFVIPPLAVSANSVNSTTLDNLCYQYRYDGSNRLVEKKLPGKGWEYMVYDKADRLIATQDANLRQTSTWFVTKYDSFGRVIYTGLMPLPNQSREGLQGITNQYVIIEYRNSTGFTRNGMQIYYTNGLYNQIETVLSINYYDTYPQGSPIIPSQVLGQNVLPQDAQNSNISTKSLPTASYVKNIEDDNWTKNYTWYDQKGRAIGSQSINHLGGYTITESALDFAGVAQQMITRHKRLDTDTEKVITENFTYDHQNRLLTHTHQVDNNSAEYLAQNKYNELSQLESKKVGGTSVGSGLQNVDYAYNIRGWMTKINDPTNLINGKLFGYEIKYNNPENTSLSTARFNGNIAEVDWKTVTTPNDNKRRYSYQYDALNRLQQGIYTEPGSSLVNNDHYNEYLTYDLNGNISTLKRFSKPYSGTTAEKIDDLIYNYTGNRLDNITLPAGEMNNYSGYNALGITFTYDPNGNMKSHGDKRIGSIIYNHLNIPSVITSGNGFKKTQTTYTYRADGTKLRKVNDGAALMSSQSTDYLDGFQYFFNNDFMTCIGCPTPLAVLQFVPTSEGYFDFEKNKYIYSYSDHLGNTRLSYFNGSNGIEVLEENNYYPFGLKHEGYNQLQGNYSYQYKYNGKELQTETGMYDYGARFYMPDIGRWGVVDPRSQYTHEAYSYVWNNPISLADPTGMQGEEVSDWITNGNGGYKWDPKVTGPENTPNGWKYIGPTGSYRIPGATVQLLEGGKKFTDIDKVAVSGVSPATAGIVLSQNARFGVFAFLAVASWYVISDFVHTNTTQYGTRIDPMMHSPRTMNAESDAGSESSAETDSTDVNGVNVPDARKGGGKNGQHANLKAKQSAGEKYEQAKSKLDSISRKPNKTKEDNKLKTQLEKNVKHWKAKAQETGENHSRNAKGNR
ncbi:DUF6443 domain-containing protein [Chryseobacterium wangxinyae]|uniref:DUF6443 domain-containing protein n=1 Tax=Chryseobacterium sp. CY353 TaxID=2997334 RepID=UPI00226F23B2|nr:DUF6443 domain-containing protein [Chryseobacterium sp. CY353]MCY0968857.1 DUF6443 domain-containing protein [Chryseobacterium sp. CY353]